MPLSSVAGGYSWNMALEMPKMGTSTREASYLIKQDMKKVTCVIIMDQYSRTVVNHNEECLDLKVNGDEIPIYMFEFGRKH